MELNIAKLLLVGVRDLNFKEYLPVPPQDPDTFEIRVSTVMGRMDKVTSNWDSESQKGARCQTRYIWYQEVLSSLPEY